MFKLKAGNVFEKINNMDRKQAYTIGAIGAVLLVALLMLFSLMGAEDDSSLENFQARGYDLASMPFINDEAEELLLSSKYPDMQGNSSSLLFSQQEKEERQEADAEEEGEEEEELDLEENEKDSEGGPSGAYSGGRSGGGYGGRGGGAGRGKTEVGRLGGASMGRSGGSGMSGSFGAPRGDYSPYKTQNKGEERPIEFKNQDARRALSQFAKGSRAAAGLRDGKLANAKRALQGGDILGSEAFAGNGVDLSKTNGLALDTNAPIGSNPDLSNLKDKVASEAQKAENKQKQKDKEKEKGFFEKLFSAVGDAMINSIANAAGDLMNMGLDAVKGGISSWHQGNKTSREMFAAYDDAGSRYKAVLANGGKPSEALDTTWNSLSETQRSYFGDKETLNNMFSYVNQPKSGSELRTNGILSMCSSCQTSIKNAKADGWGRYFDSSRYHNNKDYAIGNNNNNNNNGRDNNGQKCSSGWKVDEYGNSYCS